MNERVAEHRQRMADSGYRQIALQLPDKTIRDLDKLCDSTGQSRAVLVEQLINGASKKDVSK